MEKKEEKLLEEFSPVNPEEWKEKVEKDLKGKKHLQDLYRTTFDGIDIAPFYTRQDLPENHNQPGTPPYRRGIHAQGNDWEARQAFMLSQGVNTVRKSMFKALENGISSFSLLDDTGDFSSSDIPFLLKDFPLNSINFHFPVCQHPQSLIRTLKETAEEQGYQPKDLSGSIHYDPIGQAMTQGNWEKNKETALERMGEVLTQAKSELPGFRVFGINGQAIREAGGSITQEIAFSLATAQDIAASLTDKGHSIDDVSAYLEFRKGLGSDFFMEIAASRALRILWSKIVEQYEPEHECSQASYIHGSTLVWNKTIYDPYVNMVRNTTEAMAGILGNCDALTIMPFDHFFRKPDPLSDRISRNLHHLLKEESHLNKVSDPGGGSYYIEKITDEIAEKAWDLLRDIERSGGFIEAMENGLIHQKVDKVASLRKKSLEEGSLVILGVNKYPNEQEFMAKAINIDPEKIEEHAFGPTNFPPLIPWRAAANLEKDRLRQESVST